VFEKMKKQIYSVALLAVVAAGSFYIGRVTATEYTPMIQTVNYDELNDMIEDGESFIAYYHRSSCQMCAIVSDSLPKYAGLGIPVVSFNMEDYMGTDEYDQIKESLNFTYFPTFKYYSDGKEAANLNCPLSGDYYDTEYGPDRQRERKRMEEKLESFIKGAAGLSPIVHEEPLQPVIYGEEVEAPIN